MKKIYYLFTLIISMFVIIFMTSNQGLSHSTAAPFGNTGSPGDGGPSATCARLGCHATTVNTGPGILNIDLSDIPSSGWAPGETYAISVHLTEGTKMTYGFELTVEDSIGNKKGSFTGNSTVVVANQFWPTHHNTSATGNWTFGWTAPTDNSQKLIFYASGNAANGNGNSTGDNIYTTSLSVERDLFAGLPDMDAKNKIKIKGNPAHEVLITEAPAGTLLRIYSMNGQLLQYYKHKSTREVVNISQLQDGVYLLTDGSGKFTSPFVVN